jgi:hypothetical protein
MNSNNVDQVQRFQVACADSTDVGRILCDAGYGVAGPILCAMRGSRAGNQCDIDRRCALRLVVLGAI